MLEIPNGPCLDAEPSRPCHGQARLQAWIDAIVARDERALAALRAATSARVHASVMRIVSSREQSEEIVADCFWQVWRTAVKYEPERGNVLGWILTIARSRAIDALRRGRAGAMREAHLDEEAQELLADPASLPTERVELVDRDRRLGVLLRSMEPVQRQLLSLAFFLGLSHQEIAQHCGLPLGTVKSHLRRALQQMAPRCREANLLPHA